MSLALKVTFFLPVVPMATERRFEARMAAMRSWSLAERTFTLCLQAIFLLSVPPPPFEATAALAAELPKSDLATGLLPRHDEEDSDESDDEAAEMEESDDDDELELFLSAELGVFWSEFVSVESLEEPSPSEPSLLSTTSFLPLAATALPPVPQLFVGARVLLVEVLRTLLSFRSVVAAPVDASELEICLGAGSGARLAAAAADAAAASSALRLAC